MEVAESNSEDNVSFNRSVDIQAYVANVLEDNGIAEDPYLQRLRQKNTMNTSKTSEQEK